MAANIAEDRKERFIKLLHELFQLDKPELDFGLYRIMHAKSDQLSRFIREDLSEAIEAAFAEQGEQQLATLRHDIEEKRRQAEEFGAPDPDGTSAVKQARAAYDVAKREQNASADIYDHLYRFFSRYYDKGDFMSRRHHVAENDSRAAPYAVPFDGREVYLHWANKDQYYVKSSETLANFTFNLNEALKKLQGAAPQGGLSFDSVDSALKVHCRVVEATEGEHNDVKESSERFFIIHHDEPMRLLGADLVLQFEYRPDPDKTGQSGTWQKKRLEEAEEVIMSSLRTTDGVAAYRDGLATPAPTEKQKSRTLLGKYLQQYTARNTMDYFIHKDLGGFLSRELDFYIKNEILRLDDIDNADVLIVEQQLKKIQVLRKIAKQIITFLAQLENFQKKLWLKKKFVTNSDYCITLDRLEKHGELLKSIFRSDAQIKQWQEVCSLDPCRLSSFLEKESVVDVVKKDEFRYLMVDTACISSELKADVLACIHSIDESTGGVIINSDNYQSLSLSEAKYLKSVGAVYIDPPYNTDASAILYKNDYKDSSWISLMHDRLRKCSELMRDDGMVSVAIDDEEFSFLNILLTGLFDKEIGVAPVRSNPQSRKSKGTLSPSHEYAVFYGKTASCQPGSLDLTDKRMDRYPLSDDKGRYAWMNLIRTGTNDRREDRPKLFYPIYVSDADGLRVPKMEWIEGEKKYFIKDKPASNEVSVYPVRYFNDKKIEKRWHRGWQRVIDEPEDYRVRRSSSGEVSIDFKTRIDSKAMASTWWDRKEYASANYGTAEIKELFGESGFDFPKATTLVEDCLKVILGESRSGVVFDFFAGSGTTAHALINLEREWGGESRYVLSEVGEHFYKIIKPRIQKAVFSASWKEGYPHSEDGESFGGISHCFKYLRLESYDDTLNNLELNNNPQRDALMEENSELRSDYTLKYLLEIETRGSASLLNTEWFRDPESYTLKVKQPGSDETRETSVDLVETFNWLIGLHVTHLDKPRTYVARFEREADPELPEDHNTRLKAVSLRENEDGAYWIRQVEGRVRRIPGSDEDLAKVLVVWRKLTDDPEKDAAVLEALLAKYKIGTTDSEFDAIYINGPHGLNLAGSARSRVHSLEETFHARMWEGCDDDL
ncbi:DNA methyltransferase [Halomonas sp. 5021]|uniref:site-specific DNA-methyltransferase n=1 Tax=Halomonas sp. 5021 TaxID=3082156 RepID=UPI002FC7B067